MKRFLSALTALLLCCALVGCGTGNETHDYILHLLEEGEYDMAIHVIEGLRDIDPAAPATVPEEPRPGEAGEEVFTLSPEFNGSDWIFHMDLINTAGTPLTLEALVIRDFMDGQEIRSFEHRGPDLALLPIGGLTLAPDSGVGWDDGHPAVDFFNSREYCHIFRTANGDEFRIRYIFDMTGLMPQPGAGQEPAGSWSFPAQLVNGGDTPLTLLSMDITNLVGGEPTGTFIFEGEEALAQIGLGGLTLQPGESFLWLDGHPYTQEFNGREYRFHFRDGRGDIQVQTFRFEDLLIPEAVDYSQDTGRDLQTLRHDAAFEVEVAPGVYWVNASSLGGSRYTNQDIYSMLPLSPEEKRDAIATVYEALQLYQIGNFTPSDDNVRIYENGINWEHHKPGYHAVRTNTGCCATDSNWLHYLLEGDYEEVGFLATSQRDGSGHVYNYILHDGWYYFIDLTHYHAQGFNTAPETGDTQDYYATDYILGNIHKAASFSLFAAYVQNDFWDPPGLMFCYTWENVLAIDSMPTGGGVEIVYEEAGGLEIQVIYDDPGDSLTYRRAPSPQELPDWSRLP